MKRAAVYVRAGSSLTTPGEKTWNRKRFRFHPDGTQSIKLDRWYRGLKIGQLSDKTMVVIKGDQEYTAPDFDALCKVIMKERL
jgi:hypothetical protein